MAKNTKKKSTPPVTQATKGESTAAKKEADAPKVEVKELTKGKSANASCPPSMEKIMYGKGEAYTKYNPRVAHTIEAWEKVQKAMGAVGMASHAVLCTALAEHFTKVKENHHDFIGYMVRRSSLRVQK